MASEQQRCGPVSGSEVQAEPVDALGLRFNGTGESLKIDLSAYMLAGTASAVVTLRPKEKAYEVQLHADGIRLEQLQTIRQRNLLLAGALNIDVTGKGTFDNPALEQAASNVRCKGRA